MSKKTCILLLCLASSATTYAVKGENQPVATKNNKPCKGNKKEKTTATKKQSALLPLPSLSKMVQFELLGGVLVIVYYYNTYVARWISLSMLAVVALGVPVLEVFQYYKSMQKKFEKKNNEATSDMLTLSLIRLLMHIGFEMIGVGAFFCGSLGLLGIRERSSQPATLSASIFSLIALTLLVGIPTAIHFFLLKPEQATGNP